MILNPSPLQQLLSEEQMAIIDVIGAKEHWPADHEPYLEEVIEKINQAYEGIQSKKHHLSKLDPKLCVSLMAILSIERCIRLLQEIGDQHPEKIKEITGVDLEEELIQVYFATLMKRLNLIIRTNFINRIYSRERRELIYKYLLEGVRDDD